jgi:hypothetical protein
MAQLSAFDPTKQRLMVLAKGDNGTGKTIGAASFTTPTAPTYIFDVDDRIAAVANYYKHEPNILNYIEYDRYDDHVKIKEKIEGFMKERTRCKFKNIIWDGITSSVRMIMDKMIAERIADIGENAAKLEKQLQQAGTYVSQIEDFRGEDQALSDILTRLRSNDLKHCNIFVMAHIIEKVQRGVGNKVVSVSRRIITKGNSIAAEIPIYFNEIWHFNVRATVNGPQHTIVTHNVGEDFAKTSCGLPLTFDWTNKNLREVVTEFLADPEAVKRVNEAEKKSGGWT